MSTTVYRLTLHHKWGPESNRYKSEDRARALFDQADLGTMHGQVTGAVLSEVVTDQSSDAEWSVVTTRTRVLATKGEIPER